MTARPSQDCSGSLEFVGTVKHAEEGLQQIVDFVRHIITVVSPNGKIIYANRVAREYTGLTLDEYRSVDVVARIIHPDDAARMRAVRKRGLSANNPFEIEARTLGKGGACRWFREEIDKASTFEEIVGASPVLKAVLSHVSKVARCDSTVLITGETGTCKELVARAIHRRSNRASRTFVSVNCAAIPGDLTASEMLGHEKGAFTGATQQRLGRFASASGGTALPLRSRRAAIRDSDCPLACFAGARV